MRNRNRLWCLALAALLPWIGATAQADDDYTDEFPLGDCRFKPQGGNAYFQLSPARQAYYSNYRCVDMGECDELEELWITVLPEIRKIPLEIDGETVSVHARVVEEYETADGELAEISRNFFSTCKAMNDVYYFGEDVDIYEDGELASHDGAWLAGENGNQPGIIMPDRAFLLGARYYQEIAPGVAEDRAEHTDAGLTVEVPAGVFEDCVEVTENSTLDPGAESVKIYCPGIGLVMDDELELIATYRGATGSPDNEVEE